MADTRLGKIGITVKEPYNPENPASYEVLDYVLYPVSVGGDGCGYIALKDNIGVTPGSDDTVWAKASQAGLSIYDLAVKYHHFEGTEEEFEADYQAALQAARDAAAGASAVEAQVEAAETARVAAETGRADAESARQSAEASRASAETARGTAETARQSAESGRASAETARVTAEQGRVSAESDRVSAEAARAAAETDRVSDFSALKTDMETAIGQADAATAAAVATNNQIQTAEASRVSAEQGRVSAEAARASAESARATAESGRATAETARVTAEGQRATAEGQRVTAENARVSAESGRDTAESARVTAEAARVSAENARESQASSDHQTAEADHAIVQGYDTRLTNVEGEVSQLGQEVVKDGTQTSEFDYSQFGAHESLSAAIELGTDIEMTAPGDYVEIKVQANTANNILRRQTTSNPPCIRYSASNTLQVRFNGTTNWAWQNAAVDWSKVQVIKVVLDSINGTTYNYKIYLDDALVGTQAVTNSSRWNQVCYGSSGINMRIYYIETKIGGTTNRLTKFAEMADAQSVTDVYAYTDVPSLIELDERVSDIEGKVSGIEWSTIGEEMYFKFIKESTLYNVNSAFYIYQRLKGNIFAMWVVGYYVYNGEAGYPNGYWRVERMNICTLDQDLVETTIQSQAIVAGENEFVLKWLSGRDYNFSSGFSGGFHYGETIDNVVGAWVEFVADGHRLETSADIPMTPCKSFYYREYSPIYQHNDNTIAAWHLKETEFKDGGYETINDVKFVQALDYFAYPGIVCVSRWLSEKAMPEGVATITDMGDGSTTIAEQFKSSGHRIHYEGNGYMCDVESEMLIGADDAQCQRVVYNSSTYNKFYRRNPDTAGSTSNRLKGRTTVKISAL